MNSRLYIFLKRSNQDENEETKRRRRRESTAGVRPWDLKMKLVHHLIAFAAVLNLADVAMATRTSLRASVEEKAALRNSAAAEDGAEHAVVRGPGGIPEERQCDRRDLAWIEWAEPEKERLFDRLRRPNDLPSLHIAGNLQQQACSNDDCRS